MPSIPGVSRPIAGLRIPSGAPRRERSASRIGCWLRTRPWTVVIDGEDHYTCGLLDFAWSEGEDVETSSGSAASLELGQNHPNPFQAATFIDYQIPCGSDVRLRIYDVCGREVRTLVDGFRPAASYSLRFDAGSLPSGIYFYGLSAGGRPCVTRRMVLVR